MPRKRHKPEEVVAKLRQVDVMVVQGTSLAEAIRSIGVSEGEARAATGSRPCRATTAGATSSGA